MMNKLAWEAPDAGDWWSVREHFPYPVSQLFATLFPAATVGWKTGGARYGLTTGEPRWAAVNGFIYFGPPHPLTADEHAAREIAAVLTLAAASATTTTPWQTEVRRWHDEERPAARAANLGLQAVDVQDLDDVALSAHLQRTMANFGGWAPLHFEHTAFDIAAGFLLRLTDRSGIAGHAVIELLTGASPASAAVDRRLGAVAEALEAAGAPRCSTLGEVRDADVLAAAALDSFLEEYRWRPVAGHDVLEPTLGERPDLLVASIAARRARHRAATDVTAAADAMRCAVPEPDRATFDRLLTDARAAYALRDDDVGICWNWPLGLIRRAGLETGRRLAAANVIEDPGDVFEAAIDELPGVLAGRGPGARELARRRDVRVRAAASVPPMHLAGGGSPVATPTPTSAVAELTAVRDRLWSVAPPRLERPLHGIGINAASAVGRARVVAGPDDIANLEDGDILVAVATSTAFNAVFPLVAAVVTEQGGILSHAAILAREVGVPAVVGVADVFDFVRDGDIVEVNPIAGSVRVVDPPAPR